jgi:hypothetical protein
MRQTLFVRAQRWSWAAAALLAACSEPPAANAPPAKNVPQASIPAGAESQESAVTSCSPGFELECDTGCDNPRDCHKPMCRCIPIVTTETGLVVPNFFVTHVVYAPPGKMSSVTYADQSSFGSSTSETHSHKGDVKVTAGIAIPSKGFFAGSGLSISGGKAWGGSDTTTTDVLVETTSSWKKPGQTDIINHDDDEIWFLIDPKMEVTVQSSVREKRVSWRFASDQTGTRMFFAYVGDLKNPAGMPPSVRQTLDEAGITEDYYPQLLQADPFAYDSMMMPSAMFPRDRFECVTNIAYQPPREPGQGPGMLTHSVNRKEMASTTEASETSYTAGYKIMGSVNFAEIWRASLTVEGNWTWTHSTSTKLSTGNAKTDTFVISQPTTDYNGPTNVSVYVDKIWKTYVFNLDWAGCDP